MRLLFPDYWGLQLILKAPQFPETFHSPSLRFQRKVTDRAALPPSQSRYLNLIGMRLVPQQSCWPDPPFQKGHPAPTPNPPNPELC